MVVQAEAAEEVLHADSAAAERALRKIQETGREALGELRSLVGILRDPNRDAERAPQPGLSSLDRLITQVDEAGIPIELRVVGKPRDLPPGVDLSAYRIVQEALTNILKHAGRASASVVLDYRNEALIVEVADTGRGSGSANGHEHGLGHGLAGMRERAALLGGELDARALDGGGFVVRAELPVGRP
jgi:signal transduction histidine kinase